MIAALLGVAAIALAGASDAHADAGADAGADADVAIDAGGAPDAAEADFEDLASIPIGGDVRVEDVPDAGAAPAPPLVASDLETAPAVVHPVPKAERPVVVIKTILGLVVLLTLAYLAGNARVRNFERRIGVSQLITAGFPFIALGLIARLPAVGILTDSVLAEIAPVLRIGLGWIGFSLGLRFDVRVVEQAVPGSGAIAAIRSLVTLAVIAVMCGAALLFVGAVSPSELTELRLLRDALILGTAGSLTSLVTPRLLAARGVDEASVRLVDDIARIEELLGVVALLAIAAYFRPTTVDATWRLPGTAWVLLTIGLGAAIGLVLYAVLLRERTTQGEWVVVVLGSVAFAAGLSGKLQLSPVVVCFLVGFVLANFPGRYRGGLRRALVGLQRPVYLVFMVIVGALWDATDWRGWALMVVFVGARFASGWVGTRIADLAPRVDITPAARQALSISPFGALALAIVVNAQMLYPGGTVPLIVTAILGGAIVTEVVFQLATRTANDGGRTDRESLIADEEEVI